MKFLSTNLADAFVVVPDRIEDERGFFARSFCEREFAARNQTVSWVQCNISFLGAFVRFHSHTLQTEIIFRAAANSRFSYEV